MVIVCFLVFQFRLSSYRGDRVSPGTLPIATVALAGFIDLALLSEQRHVEIRSRIPSSSSLSSWQMGLGDGLAGSRRAVLAYQ
ncbi:uncharacterized protein LMH87_009213 [Akanthomyces muscarius]|uniref:Uncharacterized protein n=1 Tax=Akanthomyces muscarius TaxID=2231603 RepID=A0A9W8QIR4_AKAMU|nr:uncharacterized protein LMH87_009213 [Akanthomyces muscarius]KAJ4158698.1 hypothetical protein LMH87_009213 [Akanthomyces muscarius]